MNKKEYTTPDFEASNYTPMMVVAMSWSDEETGEALAPDRGDYNTDFEEDFWEGREQAHTNNCELVSKRMSVMVPVVLRLQEPSILIAPE